MLGENLAYLFLGTDRKKIVVHLSLACKDSGGNSQISENAVVIMEQNVNRIICEIPGQAGLIV